MDPPPVPIISRKLFLCILITSVILLYLHPWIITFIPFSFGCGYYSILHFDYISEHVLKKWNKLTRRLSLTQNISTTTMTDNTPTDPLQSQLLLSEALSMPVSKCEVCLESNCHRDSNHQIKHCKSSPELCVQPPKPFQLPKVDDLKIPSRLDASISKFCTTVFDYYISSDWAPYETRKQLKLAFKKLLTVLGEKIDSKFIKNEKTLDKFCKTKLSPLLLNYLEKIQKKTYESYKIFPWKDQLKAKLRVRKLCRHVLERALNDDDRNCRLWMELCIAVLADGVVLNLITLGRDKIPELLQYYYVKHINFSVPSTNDKSQKSLPTVPVSETVALNLNSPEVPGNFQMGYDETDKKKKLPDPGECIPFLLDNFLDRKDSLEQPDPIVSRWRPNLKDIIEETELLYPLIQHLKHVGGQKALAYLQAVLDDSPDAKDYCRRVLEVEYLPGFCRSHFFHESMGLSRVEQGLEVITDGSPGSNRKVKGHLRSASYGSKSNQAISDLLKIEGGIVDGLPLYYDPDYGSVSANSSTSSGYSSGGQTLTSSTSGGPSDSTDSLFRRKPQLEDIVAKFYKSTLSLGTSSSGDEKKKNDHSGDKTEPVSRVGIDAKSYEEWEDPEVNKRVKVDATKCDILESISDTLTSSISVNPWLGPIVSGWLRLLHPYLKPYFESQLEQKLSQFLTLDLFITSVDLITDAFIRSGEVYEDASSSNSNSAPASPLNINIPLTKNEFNTKVNSSDSDNSCNNLNIKSNVNCDEEESRRRRKEELSLDEELIVKTFLKSFVDFFISKIISLDTFLSSLSTNRDYIFLFFIDVLDLLVAELFGDQV